ncbi:hypothetical protein NRB56_70970 [Nocardia sp. RB56]|uniref:Uncharacterized protein n=1 Tax=Nocardia aurantia TaxID=2585199 RepID=A0A7K0E108_9NOCA|nr:hypothetical protein [Nocardia aurantia]
MGKHRKRVTPASRAAEALYTAVLVIGMASMAEVFFRMVRRLVD